MRAVLGANPELPEELYEALARCARYLENRGIDLILFGGPVYDRFLDGIEEASIERLRAYMARLREEEGVEFHDFSRDPDFSHDSRLFFDLHHLNRVGAERFSRTRLRPLIDWL